MTPWLWLFLIAQTFTTTKVQPDQVLLLTTPKPRVVSRLLVRFPLDTTLCTQVVDALLELRSPAGIPANRRLILQIVPVTTPWQPDSVSWTHPWLHPGGDFDATVARFVALPPPGQKVSVDLTLFVRNCHLYHGILVKPPAFRGIGFSGVGRYLQEALKNATLTLKIAPTSAAADTSGPRRNHR